MFLSEDHILNRKLAVEALRTEPEERRVCKMLVGAGERKHMVCAIALLALKFGMPDLSDSTTSMAVEYVGEALGLNMERVSDLDTLSPGENLLANVVQLNDEVKDGYTQEPAHTWKFIGDYLETELEKLAK